MSNEKVIIKPAPAPDTTRGYPGPPPPQPKPATGQPSSPPPPPQPTKKP